MSSVKEKYLEQKTKVDSFIKAAQNYSKDGSSRKTSDYLVQKKESFFHEFKLIKENHVVLLANKDETQDFSKKNIFDTIEQLYNKISTDIENRLARLNNDTGEASTEKLDTSTDLDDTDPFEKTFYRPPTFIDATDLEDDGSVSTQPPAKKKQKDNELNENEQNDLTKIK